MAKVDSLEIELKSNASKVAKDFDKLTSSLNGTSKALTGMNADEFEKVASGVKSFKRSAKSSEEFSKSLKEMASSISSFVNSINSIDTSKFDTLVSKMDTLAKIGAKNMKSMTTSMKSLDTSAVKKNQQSVDAFMDSIKGLGKTRNFFGNQSQLNNEILRVENNIEKIKTKLEEYNQEGKSVETKGWRTAQRQLEEYTNYLDTLKSKQRTVIEEINQFGIKKIQDSQLDKQMIAKSKDNIYKLQFTDEEYAQKRQEILKELGNIEIDIDVSDNAKEEIKRTVSDIKIPFDKSKMYGMFDSVKEKAKETQQVVSQVDFTPTKLGDKQTYTKEYKDLEKQIIKAEATLEKFLNTQERMDELGVKQSSQRYKNVEISIRDADAQVQRLYADMKALQESGGDVKTASRFDVLSEKASNVQSVLQSLAKSFRAFGAGGAASHIQSLGANVGSLSNGLATMGATAEGASASLTAMQTAIPIIGLILVAVTALVNIFMKLANVAVNAFKKIGGAIKSVVTKVKDLVKNILSIGTSSYQAQTAIGKFINKIIGLFKSRVLRQAVTQAMQYMKDGFKELDAYSARIGTPFHNNVVMIITDLKWLGRSIAAAFEPIINVASPILDFLIDKLVTVINYINQFFSALTGSGTWTKAIKTASGYEDSVGGAAKAQKDLNKAIREWDKLNVITDPNKNNGGGGAGGSSGAGNPFVTEEVDNGVKNFVQRIKDAWKDGADFTDIGADIGQKVKESLDKIEWDGIKESARKVGTGIATLINGFVKVDGLASTIGNSIAEGINTLLEGFSGFVGNIEGKAIGEFVGNLVGSSLKNINWKLYITSMGDLGKQLASFINGIADTDALSDIAKAFANVLKGAIEGAYKFVTTLDFKELGTKIGTAITDFFKEMNEVGEDGLTGWQKAGLTIKGVVDGIQDLFANLKDNIDMEEVKKGVLEFIGGLIDPEKAKEKLKEKLQEAILKLVTGDFILPFSLYDLLKLGDDKDSPLEKIKTAWTNAESWLKTNLLTITAKIPDIKAGIDEKLQAVKDTAINIALNVADNVSGVVEKIKTNWSKLKFKKKELTAKLKGGAQDKIQKLKTAWNNLKTGTKNFTTNIKGTAYNALIKIKDAWDSLSTKAKNIAITFTDNFTAPLKRAWNNLANGINNAVGKISDKIPKIPTFPGYATGGFPEDGWFRASHGEYFGKFDNGQSVIANNRQIENGLMNTVRMGNSELVTLMSQELTATRQQNELLSQILQKETGINYKDVFKATQKGANEYKKVTGMPAFI